MHRRNDKFGLRRRPRRYDESKSSNPSKRSNAAFCCERCNKTAVNGGAIAPQLHRVPQGVRLQQRTVRNAPYRIVLRTRVEFGGPALSARVRTSSGNRLRSGDTSTSAARLTRTRATGRSTGASASPPRQLRALLWRRAEDGSRPEAAPYDHTGSTCRQRAPNRCARTRTNDRRCRDHADARGSQCRAEHVHRRRRHSQAHRARQYAPRVFGQRRRSSRA